MRRIYVDQESVVLAHHQTNVSVKITRHSPYATSPNWVIEPKAVGPGVLTARTLLAEDAPCAAVRVINYTDDPVRLSKGTCMGTALPAEVCELATSVELTGNGRKFSADADKLNGNLFRSAAVGKRRKCCQQQSANAGNYNRDPSKCRQQTAMTGNSVGNPNCLPSLVYLKNTYSRCTSRYLRNCLPRNDGGLSSLFGRTRHFSSSLSLTSGELS